MVYFAFVLSKKMNNIEIQKTTPKLFVNSTLVLKIAKVSIGQSLIDL